MSTAHALDAMRRIQFIEIHDQSWVPSVLRHEITNALQFGLNLFKAYSPITSRLQNALDSTGSEQIIDLCSGGGGPWADLSRKVHGKAGTLKILLTDKFPNLEAAQNIESDSGNQISFHAAPVDAMRVPRELTGLRTMFTSFHHFSPAEARAVVQDAVDAIEGIAIFEITRRAPLTVAFMLVWVGILCACTPWIRPFRWSQLFWTFIVPVIPMILLFDGVVSCLRTYRPQELQEIAEGLSASGYEWEIGEQGGRMPITYLIGRPARKS